MRDIFGVDIRAGDLLELWYGKYVDKDSGTECVQILPVSGCTETEEDSKNFKNNQKLPNWFQSNYGQGDNSIYYEFYVQLANDNIVRVPIGKLWATPLHHRKLYVTMSNLSPNNLHSTDSFSVHRKSQQHCWARCRRFD